jgi:hypothetical protein
MRPDDDRDLLEAIRRAFRPEPMDAARQSAFRRRLEERLARGPRALHVAAPALAVATAVAALWIAIPVAQERLATDETEFSAFVDPDPAFSPSDESLPEDYVVLASLLELDSGER